MTGFRLQGVAVIALWAEDVPTAAHFYRNVVGLRPLPHHDSHLAFPLGNGAHLVLIKGEPVPARSSDPTDFPLIAFAVDDLEGAIEHLRDCAVELPWGVETSEYSRWVKFRDPAGNLIEFVQFSRQMQR